MQRVSRLYIATLDAFVSRILAYIGKILYRLDAMMWTSYASFVTFLHAWIYRLLWISWLIYAHFLSPILIILEVEDMRMRRDVFLEYFWFCCWRVQI